MDQNLKWAISIISSLFIAVIIIIIIIRIRIVGCDRHHIVEAKPHIQHEYQKRVKKKSKNSPLYERLHDPGNNG